MPTCVTAVPAADPISAARHFETRLMFETDCWDVHEALAGEHRDFVLLDVRSRAAYAKGHIAGAVSLPHAAIDAAAVASYPQATVFIVYCAGPHCNGADRAALRLARLGRPVKMMIGGITGWLDEGFKIESDAS